MPPGVRPAQEDEQSHLVRSLEILPSLNSTVRSQLSGHVGVVGHDDDGGLEACVEVAHEREDLLPVRVSRFPVGSSASRMGG